MNYSWQGWGLNEVFPHKVISPHFLHLEIDEGDEEFFNHVEGREGVANSSEGTPNTLCPRHRFKNGTVLVMEQGRDLIADIPCLIAMPKRGYDRTGWGKGQCTPETGRFRPHGNEVTVPCQVSLNRIMALFPRLGYDRVYLLGIDGHGGYFYSRDPYNVTWNRDALEGRPSTVNRHPSIDSGIHHWMWSFGQYNGLRLTNLAEGGKLNQTIFTQSIDAFVDELQNGCNEHVGVGVESSRPPAPLGSVPAEPPGPPPPQAGWG